MERIDTRMGIGDWIIVTLMAGCMTFCLYLTFVKAPEVIKQSIAEERFEPIAWQHFVECQAICDNYQVNLKMWNWPDKTINVYIPKDHLFSAGTDGACMAFGMMCKKLLDIYNDGWLLTVESDGFIPSAKMPIDLEWAKELAKGY